MPARSDKEKPVIENTSRAMVTMPSEREIVIERVFDAPRTRRLRRLDEGRARRALVGPKRRAARRL